MYMTCVNEGSLRALIFLIRIFRIAAWYPSSLSVGSEVLCIINSGMVACAGRITHEFQDRLAYITSSKPHCKTLPPAPPTIIKKKKKALSIDITCLVRKKRQRSKNNRLENVFLLTQQRIKMRHLEKLRVFWFEKWTHKPASLYKAML